MRIEAVEGPIDAGLLQHICDLYGRGVDSRYSDLDFTRRVFNDNPAGRSYHVFAYAGNDVVGCYAVIPMRVMARGHKLWAGKGECLYVREQYRPMGVCLIQRGISFAAERGLDLQFGLTHDRLNGLLFQLGLKTLPGVLNHRFCLLRPRDVRRLNVSTSRLIAAQALRAAQTILRSASSVLRFPVSIKVNSRDHLNAVFVALANSRQCRDDQWSVAMDVDSLQWWHSIDCLDVLTIDGKAEEFVVVTRGARGTNVEIIRWNVHGRDAARALNILKFVIDKANGEGAAAVSFAPEASLSGNCNLQLAATLSGFVRHHTQRTLCVRAADSFFLEPRNVDFSWLFSI